LYPFIMVFNSNKNNFSVVDFFLLYLFIINFGNIKLLILFCIFNFFYLEFNQNMISLLLNVLFILFI
jgi:hypothetical protein